MTTFYEDDSKLLTPAAFAFVLDSELKRAVRAQDYLTFLTVEVSREWNGMTIPADTGTVRQVAELITRDVRDTDLVGRTDPGIVALVLLGIDLEHAERVIHRMASRLENYEFSTQVRIAVGAASYPTNGADAESLKREALSRPVVNWRGVWSGSQRG